MNGEIPSVPITTLAGVASLTDLLPELPLPTPLPHTVNNKSLLYSQHLTDDARRLIHSSDPKVVSQLLSALRQTTTDHIELNDNLRGGSIEGDVPELLRCILFRDPHTFQNGSDKEGYGNGNAPPYNQHPHPSPYQAGQVSPCPPGSPARLPPTGSPYPSRRSHSQSSRHGSKSGFQDTFLSFAGSSKSDKPTVNGGFQGTPPSSGRSSRSQSKPPTASPAQAAAAPMSVDPYEEGSSSNSFYDRRKSSSREPLVMLEPLRSTKLPDMAQPKIKLTRVDTLSQGEIDKIKRLQENDRKGYKRYRDEQRREMEEIYGDFAASMGDRVKRGRRPNYAEDSGDEDDDDEDYEPDRKRRRRAAHSEDESRSPSPQGWRRRKKDNRYAGLAHLSVEELMETGTFKKFHKSIESVIESAEDVDLNMLNSADDDQGILSESIVSQRLLSDLTGEADKLKSMGVMNQIPYRRLVKVMTILQLNIKDGCKMVPINPDEGTGDDSLWRELTVERVSFAVDAAQAALSIMTAPNMPKQVYLEDVIERTVMMAKTQLINTIFPEFDPVYRIDPKNKHGIQSNMKMKRAKAHGAKSRNVLALYNKLTDLVDSLAELIDIQELTDTIILQMSTLSVAPFFVENVSELQLNSLKLVTRLFSRYEKHRQLIIEDILSSLARLPSSKKNLRNYRLNADESIQMVTALALQLIQSVAKLPRPASGDDDEEDAEEDGAAAKDRRKSKNVDNEVLIVTSYETAMRTAHNFLAVFLRKCAMKGEEDYRPLFENFVYDLLSTVNKPEWPAAELLLSLLGRLLVQQFSTKSVDMSMRVASLDYLGIVAARLRKDAISSRMDTDGIGEVVAKIKEDMDEHETKEESESEEESEEESASDTSAAENSDGDNEDDKEEETTRKTRHQKEKEKDKEKPKKKRKKKRKNELREKKITPLLQKELLKYLVYNAQNDPALVFSRQFYIAQWFRDCSVEVEKVNKAQEKQSKDNTDAEELAKTLEKNQKILHHAERRKVFLLEQVNSKIGVFANFKPSPSKLDYESALLVTRYLASNRPFSQSFDIYLTQILKVLCETAVAVRTKAMKCLTAVVEADPAILARNDMQKGVHGRFLDQSTSVREAAVELVGKFILIRPELTEQYYDMLSDRILDTGISVRKRVIKIFRDICVEQPEFKKIPEMCVKMIRRVNDEEGIKKLVNETFQNMWFTPVRDKDQDKLLTRVMNITDVVLACRDTGYEWFEQLLDNLLKKEVEASQKPVEKACTQVISCLVDKVMSLDEQSSETASSKGVSQRLVSCLCTLFLFCKVKPDLLVKHTMTIQPYLNIKCNSQGDLLVLHHVARIVELSVPLMEHPSESFLAQLEEDMMKLILKHGMMVLQSCVSCLGAVVNNVTHNYKLVRDCFQKFFGVLSKLMIEHQRNGHSDALRRSRPTLLRSLFTTGLLCKHFDFDADDFGEKKVSIRDKVFDVLMYFINFDDTEVRNKALTGMGYFCVRHYEFMMGRQLRDTYHDMLTNPHVDVRMRGQVLKNLQTYLMEEEEKMVKADAEWRKSQHHEKDDLKEMGDIQSGMASTVIQVYLKQVLESFFHNNHQVRLAALSVTTLILKQGLVHPVQCVPYLICMGTDSDAQIRAMADQQLKEIDKKYPGFIQMKALQGIKMSFQLQEVLQEASSGPIRGVRVEEQPASLNNFIYSLIRSNRNHRRAILSSLLHMFDDTQKCPLPELIYMADNLAYFPYQSQDETLYIIHQIDILVSVSGSNLLQSFHEVFYPDSEENEGKKRLDDDEDEEVEMLLANMPEDITPLQDLYMLTQACVLLLVLKQHLKEMYGFTDAKIHLYTPTEAAKTYDKPLNRKHTGKEFNPKQVLELVRNGPMSPDVDEDGKKELLEKFVEFKNLMLSIDPADEDSDDEGGKKFGAAGQPIPDLTKYSPLKVNPNPPVNSGPIVVLNKLDPATLNGAAGVPVNLNLLPKMNSLPNAHHNSTTPNDVGALESEESNDASKVRNMENSLSPTYTSRTLTTPTSIKLSISAVDRKKRPSSSHKKHKSHKHKKKKKKRHYSDSDEDEDSDDSEDPDF